MDLGFAPWMEYKGLSASSIKKYHFAIKGSLSDWARDAGIIVGSLIDIFDESEFGLIAERIRGLPIFVDRDGVGHQMYNGALNQYSNFLSELGRNPINFDVYKVATDHSIKPTQKVTLINARLGQGKYRAGLIDFWGKCCVTGHTNLTMLLASHIKPWSISSDTERLDLYNGLLLIPNLDKAFDKGLVSFDIDGRILISNLLADGNSLGIYGDMKLSLAHEHEAYMKYHRENIFNQCG